MTDAAPASLPAPVAARSTRSVLIGGASALGAVSVIERGCNFAANLLAARFAGSQVFGAYSLALTTANNVATYAGAGIGTTANRFAGRYPKGSAGYAALVRSLTRVSLVSAALAVALLFAGAGPLARLLLRNPDLTPLLQVAAASAGMMILFECLRGFLIGERVYRGLAVLALSGGLLMVVALPLAARVSAMWMVACQAAVAGVAIALCLIATRHPAAPVHGGVPYAGPLPNAGAIWRFGFVQFGGVLGLNAAGWWVAALVARGDMTLSQAGLFAVANQLRNFTSLGPNLFNQSSYSLLADDQKGATERRATVLMHCTFYAGVLSLAVGGTLAALAGWLLPVVFGPSFSGGALAASLAVTTAIVHMTSAPTSARLTIVSLRLTGVINALWTGLTIIGASMFVPRWGAAAAMGVYFGVHLISAALVFVGLRRHEPIPEGLAALLFGTLALAVTLAVLAVWRDLWPASAVRLSLVMLATAAAGTIALALSGFSRGWLPTPRESKTLQAFAAGMRLRRPS